MTFKNHLQAPKKHPSANDFFVSFRLVKTLMHQQDHIVEDVFSHIDTVDGKILHKLRLVVFPIIYKVLAPFQVVGNEISEPSTVAIDGH